MRVYLETTIPSYLTALPALQVIQAGHQLSTRRWWDDCRDSFELFTSLVTIQEAREGSQEAAQRRLVSLQDIPLLAVTPEVEFIASQILSEQLLPSKADRDALHIGVAVFHEMDFLLTWNIRHIANAQMSKKLRAFVESLGYSLPTICSPEELLPPSI